MKTRYILGFGDQVVLSLTTVVTLILAAQWLSPADLGIFVLMQSTAMMWQSVARALTAETLLVRSTQKDFHEDETRSAIALVVILASIGVCVALGVFYFLPDLGALAVGVGAVQVGLLFFDIVRHVLLVRGNTPLLFFFDLLYTGCSSSAIMVVGLFHPEPEFMLSAMGATISLLSVLALWLLHAFPKFSGIVLWVRRTFRFNSSFVVEAVLGALLGYTTILLLGILTSGAEVAAYRAVISVLGLTSVAINFLRTFVLRDLRSRHLRDSKNFVRRFGLMAGLVAVTVGVTVALVEALPDSFGVILFGESWYLMGTIFLAGAVNRFAAGVSVVPTVFLRVQGVTWKATLLRIVVTVAGFGGGPVGAYLWGASGAFLGEAVTYLALAFALTSLSWRLKDER